MNFAAYNKALTVLIGGALTWGAQVIASTPKQITAPEWLALAGVGALAFGVRQIPNAPIVADPPPVAPVPGAAHYSAPPGAVIGQNAEANG